MDRDLEKKEQKKTDPLEPRFRDPQDKQTL